MVAIPLAVGCFTRAPSNQPAVVLTNMMVEKEISGSSEDQYSRIQRPGLAAYRTVASGTGVRGLCHTQGLFDSLPLAVIGTKLYSFTNVASTELGTVANDGGFVQFAATNFGVAILSAGTLYFHDQSALLTVNIPGGETPVSITSINSYVIVACSTGKWYWIVPGESVIETLDFATAESMPDNLVAVRALRGEVYFFGTQGMEVWQPTGDDAIILTRANGRESDKGLMARQTLQPFDNSLMFLGSDGIVYRVDSVPDRVSNTGIEERIRLRTGIPSAFSYTMDGHTIYALYVPGVGTFSYDVITGEWAEYTTSGGTGGWIPRVACALGSNVLLGDSSTGKVFKLDPTISTDDGVVFERAVSGGVPFHGGRVRNDSISTHVGVSANASIRLRYHDGLDSGWSDYRSKTAKSPTDIIHYWRLGAAKQPCRVIEISCVSNVLFRVSAAWANEGRAN